MANVATKLGFESSGHSRLHAEKLQLVLRRHATLMGFPVNGVTLLLGENETCTITLWVLCSPEQDVGPLQSLFLLTVGVPSFVEVLPRTTGTPDTTTIVLECVSLDTIFQPLQYLRVIANRMRLTMTTDVVGLVVTCTFTRGDMVMNHWVEVLNALI